MSTAIAFPGVDDGDSLVAYGSLGGCRLDHGDVCVFTWAGAQRNTQITISRSGSR